MALTVFLLVGTLTKLSQAQEKITDYIVPTVLITIGTIGVYNTAMNDWKKNIKKGFSNLRGDRYLHFDDYVQYMPVTYFAVGEYVGTPPAHNINERALLGCTAAILATTLVQGTKFLVGEPRPDTRAHTSFPSGHTATAFMGAELVRLSYGNWVGLGAYTMATGIAFLRMYNERHWLNDVLAGAGIGIISANLALLLLPWEKSWFKHKKKNNADLSLMPYCGPRNTVGLAANIRF